MRIELRVNGRAATIDVDPATPLLYLLRNDLRLDGPHLEIIRAVKHAAQHRGRI